MSFLSKLLGNTKAKTAAESMIRDLLKGPNQKTSAPAPAAAPAAPAQTWESESPSGFSWGERMPDEENQYNYPGNYADYFENIFRAEFPQYRLERIVNESWNAVIFTFRDGGREALVVELMSDRSSRQRLRRDCAARGVPYLRFYHNHAGWWNTRSYVVTRTRAALGL